MEKLNKRKSNTLMKINLYLRKCFKFSILLIKYISIRIMVYFYEIIYEKISNKSIINIKNIVLRHKTLIKLAKYIISYIYTVKASNLRNKEDITLVLIKRYFIPRLKRFLKEEKFKVIIAMELNVLLNNNNLINNYISMQPTDEAHIKKISNSSQEIYTHLKNSIIYHQSARNL